MVRINFCSLPLSATALRAALILLVNVDSETIRPSHRSASKVLDVAAGNGEGFIGQVFKTLGKYLPPPAGAKSPALWGTRARLTEMFDAGAASIKAESRLFNFRYRSPEHFLDVFKTFYGPVLKAFAALDQAKQVELYNDLHALIVRMNRATDGSMIVPSEYLEVVITKR